MAKQAGRCGATYVGDRRRVGDALEQANREILAELAIADEQPLHLGDIGNLAAEYRALHLLYKPMGDAHAEMARWARERAEYFLSNVKVGDKPRGVGRPASVNTLSMNVAEAVRLERAQARNAAVMKEHGIEPPG